MFCRMLERLLFQETPFVFRLGARGVLAEPGALVEFLGAVR